MIRRHRETSPQASPDGDMSNQQPVPALRYSKRRSVMVAVIKVIVFATFALILTACCIFLRPGSAQASFHAKVVTTSSTSDRTSSSGTVQGIAKLKASLEESLGNCQVEYANDNKAEDKWVNKPLWVPSFPASGASSATKKGDMVTPIINGITGLKTGAKNYHISIRGGKLKRCKATNSDTAACTNGHPMVPIGPESRTDNFNHDAVLVLRNFMTAFPAMSNDKAIAYSKQVGQFSQQQWRNIRDEWVKSSFEGWKNLIMTWKNMKEYEIALYVPYEHLIDPTKGPDLVVEMAEAFRKAGYETTTNKDDLKCIWYHQAKKEWERIDQFYTYIPGYTAAQIGWMEEQMQAFANEVRISDERLAKILDEYVVEIKTTAQVDVPGTKSEQER